MPQIEIHAPKGAFAPEAKATPAFQASKLLQKIEPDSARAMLALRLRLTNRGAPSIRMCGGEPSLASAGDALR